MFPEQVLNVIGDTLRKYMLREKRRTLKVLDPFAGVGKIHELQRIVKGVKTTGVELEREWAEAHPQTRVGDALDLPKQWDQSFDVVATSPCYGNRMADNHNPRDNSYRRGYKFQLGRDPSEGSAAILQWGEEYREFHARAIHEMIRVTRPGGLIIVNVSNHIRARTEQRVMEWWLRRLAVSLYVEQLQPVNTQRFRQGANHELRVPYEYVICCRVP